MNAQMSDRRFCTLFVDDLLLGVAVERVEEVLRDPTITQVPLASADVAGLVNLRGQIVTAVDARHRLGLDRHDRVANSTIVVIRSGSEVVSLVVDRVGEVVDVDETRFADVPVTVGSTLAAMITGAYKLDGGLLLVIDPDETLAVTS